MCLHYHAVSHIGALECAETLLQFRYSLLHLVHHPRAGASFIQTKLYDCDTLSPGR